MSPGDGATASRQGTRSARWQWATAALAATLLAARAAHLWSPFLLLDDAFISFRYAQNLLAGHGLVYNPGERVEGYTNFLWTLLLAAGGALGLDLPRLSVALAAAAGIAAVALLARLAAWAFPESPLLAALPPLVFASLGSQPRFVVSGLETLLFAALLLLGLERLLVGRRPAAAGAAFALATMARPEGGLYWLLTLPFAAAGAGDGRRWRAALRFALPFVALYLPYFVWRWSYYGWLLPNTFYVKASDFTWARPARAVPQLLMLADRWNAWPLVALAVGALVVPAAVEGAARWRLVCWSWLLATLGYFFWVGGDFLVFFGPRFLLPALPPLLLLATHGLAGLTQPLAPRAGALLRAGVVAGLLAAALWFAWPARLGRLEALAMEQEAWTRLGHWLRDGTPPHAVLATGGAGITPYYAQRRTLDMYGLTDEHIAHQPLPAAGFRQAAHEKFDPQYVLDRRPDLLISRLSRRATPVSAGLGAVAGRVRTCYVPLLLLKVRGAPPTEEGWLLFTNRATPELVAAGYETALFRRRRGAAASDCRRIERRRLAAAEAEGARE